MRLVAKICFTLLLIAGLVRPNTTSFAPDTPSQTVSPRLKGIFKGLGSGFSK
ncbi:MAG: hypothetical protein VW417_04665 [Alphaproteobacteria bacterium]